MVSTHDDVKSDNVQTPLFRIVPIKNKGFGMIANRNISAGTMIISEKPLLSMVSDSNLDIRSMDMDHLNAKFAKPLLQRYHAMTQKEQRIFNALSYKHDGSVIDKFLNNALSEDTTGFDGVFPRIARMNHSCDSNTIHWIQPEADHNNARIIALCDIPKGTELTIS